MNSALLQISHRTLLPGGTDISRGEGGGNFGIEKLGKGAGQSGECKGFRAS